MENKLSALQASFTKNHSTQICLVSMTENWKNTLEKLSEVFDTLNHKLLIAKLGTYKLRKDALTYMKNRLSNRLQRVRLNSSFSSWNDIF